MAKKNAIQFMPDDRGIVPGSPDDYIFESYANIPEEDIQVACNILKVPRDSVNSDKVHLLFKDLWNKYL